MYTIELDIASDASDTLVKEFAIEHGCTAELLLENGPAGGNPLYKFSSEKFDYLEELAMQVFGIGFFDTETIKTMIVEQ